MQLVDVQETVEVRITENVCSAEIDSFSKKRRVCIVIIHENIDLIVIDVKLKNGCPTVRLKEVTRHLGPGFTVLFGKVCI